MSESDTKHTFVTSEDLPSPLGPYSPGVTLDDLIFVSGQGAVDPRTGELVGPDVESQTEQVFKNIETILKAAGSDLKHILRCGVFLADMTSFRR